ncbi:hypothetical protein J2S43_008027 [Catenuloplanes nepalensis]|uniref:Uncharacterized protein n=1 Tax=Catenuloplanes nepalensis TaxID=587533 RepID=A0ABT9N7M0_9ACTN|nr:hypothetical protein [Catenuloplanes nepalensis]MDP9799515.1 hypothetical protein [Catenuloplanes nepalensis]
MSDLHLDSARAAQAAHDLTDAGADLRARSRSAATRIHDLSADPPWGTDEIGAAFESRYREIESRLLTAAENAGTQVEGLGESATLAVRRVTTTDETNDELIKNTWKS